MLVHLAYAVSYQTLPQGNDQKLIKIAAAVSEKTPFCFCLHALNSYIIHMACMQDTNTNKAREEVIGHYMWFIL
jgi:hypothetical protein